LPLDLHALAKRGSLRHHVFQERLLFDRIDISALKPGAYVDVLIKVKSTTCVRMRFDQLNKVAFGEDGLGTSPRLLSEHQRLGVIDGHVVWTSYLHDCNRASCDPSHLCESTFEIYEMMERALGECHIH